MDFGIFALMQHRDQNKSSRQIIVETIEQTKAADRLGFSAAWFAEQFPLKVRYSGVSLGCQIGTVLSGGLTPVIAASLLVAGGNQPWLICIYITVLVVLSLVAALAAKDPTGAYLRNRSTVDTFEEIS